MADSFVQVPADGAGKKINAYTDANGEYNQTAVLVDSGGTPVVVLTSTPGGAESALAVRQVGTITLGGSLPAGSNVIGQVTANPIPATTATLANVAGSASSVTLRALNANRLGLIIVNDSTSYLNIKFGSAASATSYTYRMAPGQVYEMIPNALYTGIVTGIWDTAAGNARVTELTP